MFDREIKFTIAGKETSDERLLVSIPRKYADDFEGRKFPTRDAFNVAIMFAHAADAADRRYWGNGEFDECQLRNYLKRIAE